MKIFKYVIQSPGLLQLPEGAHILDAQLQEDGGFPPLPSRTRPVVWALVNETAPMEDRIRTFFTGQDVPAESLRERRGLVQGYIKTLQGSDGLVWHVFDLKALK